MNKHTLRQYVKSSIGQYPVLKEEILDFYDLFESEIEDEGASIEHEVSLCHNDIEDLIKRHEKEKL